MLKDFKDFYVVSNPFAQKHKGVISANNRFKLYFDLLIMAILMLTATVVPYRLAFRSWDDSPTWIVIYNCIDILFLIDIILTFNTSYSDE